MLCRYSTIFGEPNKGFHSVRLFNIAILDVVATIIGGYLLSRLFKTSFLLTTVILFLLGILLHRLFCVRTTIDQSLFPNL